MSCLLFPSAFKSVTEQSVKHFINLFLKSAISIKCIIIIIIINFFVFTTRQTERTLLND